MCPFFLTSWMQHQRRDAYWRHGSICEDYSAIECPVYAARRMDRRLHECRSSPAGATYRSRKGLIGPWAHAYPHFALPGPQVGFLKELLRWWDYWLKGLHTGVMDEPMLRAWMTASAKPAPDHGALPGRWIAEPSWPPAGVVTHRLFLSDNGLRAEQATFAARHVCSTQTLGSRAGEWCPFGYGADQADDQREDDMGSLTFETAPLETAFDMLGPPIVTLDVACDKPIANLVVRLCDVHPSEESLRVSYASSISRVAMRRDPHTPCAGQRYRVRIQLNDTGSTLPAGRRIRLAISTSYWPMIWPSPENATVTIFGGALDLPVRSPRPTYAFAAVSRSRNGSSRARHADPSGGSTHRPHRPRDWNRGHFELPG